MVLGPEIETYEITKAVFLSLSQHVKPIPDLQVFAVLLHTHLAGRKIRAAHYRWLRCMSEIICLSTISLICLFGTKPRSAPVLSDEFVTVALLFCRNGQQIDFFLVDENYNFDIQQTVLLGNIKTIKQVRPEHLQSRISRTNVLFSYYVIYLNGCKIGSSK